MNKRMVLAVGLLATLLTTGLAFGLTFISSNHSSGSSLPRPTLVLANNATGVTTYTGDTFHLTVTATGLDGKLVTFYDNNTGSIGATTIIAGSASLDYIENFLSWDIHAEANY